VLPHSFALRGCSVYNSLFSCCFFSYRNFISFFVLSALVCISVRFAAFEVPDVFMCVCAYLGVTFRSRRVLLKYMFALQLSSFLLVFIYLCMLLA
jgi:hypothetical protein